MPLPSIVLIGQSDFSGAGRSKDRRNDLARHALVAGAHAHHSDEVHFECKIFHGRANFPHPNTAVAHLIPWSHEPVPRFTCPDMGGQTEVLNKGGQASVELYEPQEMQRIMRG